MMPAIALWGLVKRFWPALPILALAIALIVTRGTLAGAKADRDIANAKLAVSNASIDRLTGELERVMREQQALSQGDAERTRAARQALELVNAASAVRQAAIDRLRASAATMRPETSQVPLPASCQVSEAVAEVWK